MRRIFFFSIAFFCATVSAQEYLATLKHNKIFLEPLDIDGYEVTAKYEKMVMGLSIKKKFDASATEDIFFNNNESFKNIKNSSLNRINQFNETVKIIEKSYDSSTNYFHLRNIEKSQKNYESPLLLLAQIALYQQLGNSVRMEIVLQQFIRKEAYLLLFDLDQLAYINSSERELFYKNFQTVINYIAKNVQDDTWRVIFVEAVSDMVGDKELGGVTSLYLKSWPLQEMNSKARSKRYGGPICSYWYFKLKQIEGLINVNEYLDFCLTKKSLEEMTLFDSWILLYYSTADSGKRLAIRNKLKDVASNENSYVKFIKMRMLRNEVYSEMLSGVSTIAKLPLFRVERDFYKELFKNKEALPLATYHLLRLGERGEELLLWPSLQKKL